MFFEYLKNFDDYKIFSLAHILYIVFGIVLAVIFSLIFAKKNEKIQRTILVVCASIIVFNFVALQLWRVYSFAEGRQLGIIDKVAYIVMPNEILPFQLCSMLCYVIPLAVFSKSQKLYNALGPICLIGGFLFFFFPDGIINRYPPLSFRVLESMLQHTVILFFGLYLMISGKAEMRFKNIKDTAIIGGAMGVIALIANLVFAKVDDSVNFFYIRKDLLGLGLPMIATLPIMIAIVAVLIAAIYGVANLINKKKIV